jgi:hypothetical protein
VKPEPVTVEFDTEIATPTFAEVEALFNSCERAGLYGPADRASLPIMFALDAGAALELVTEMHERIDRCSRCAFLARIPIGRPFCAGKGAHKLPADRGAWCAAFHPLDMRP